MSRCPECGMKECCGGSMSEEIDRLRAELAECKRDAERYQWLRQAPGLKLESQFSHWTDEDGAPFTTTHRLAAYECQAGAYTTMDELIDSMIEMTDELFARYRKRYPADSAPPRGSARNCNGATDAALAGEGEAK